MHYSGQVCYDTARTTVHVLGGFAACVSGQATIKIRNEGRTTPVVADVTCRKCLAIIDKRVQCRSHPRKFQP